MSDKTIEIYYDIADIPGLSDRSDFSAQALDFRNAAMDHIEAALIAADAGDWQGAEIGAGEVNFGFSVDDFDQAEAVVRQAVAGTRFENIREIVRHAFTEEELASLEAATADIKPLGFFGLIGLLLFKRMPKRFRNG
ncbi:hypothetical protein [Actibacterium ureilyticum]|uniref:hypothetical protein n=1 Tax=Actibacterium ureilyticum TaxID=1590614 RepID=UPI000BAAF046|nr:hypothetical protein [Actibacterium ureilyticum]